MKEPSDWYNVSVAQFVKMGGGGLLQYYKQSLLKALQDIYPDYNWLPYHFSKPHNVPKGKEGFSKQQYVLFQFLKSVSRIQIQFFNHFVMPKQSFGITKWLKNWI